MTRCNALALRLREVFLDGKWIANTNVQQAISSVNWIEASQRPSGFNSVAALTFHLDYYLKGLVSAYETGVLDINDKFSFDLPEIKSERDWEALKADFLLHAELFSKKIEDMSDSALDVDFIDKKYGTNLRNIEATIEHSYYHLGQMVLIKKLIEKKSS